jgi:probable F420-dependent oxidoreductase
MSAVRFGVGLPQADANGRFDADAIGTYVKRAEALGFDGLWAQENFFGGVPQLDALELLTFAAAHTRRVRLGCAVFLSVLRTPVPFAKSLATLDQLSGGRLIVGVGLGRADRSAAFGVDPATRAARFSEGVELMRKLWTEHRTTFHGRFWQVDDARLEPRPVQVPHPPLWFGASHPNALRRAVRLGDGFIGAGGVSTEDFAAQVQTLRGFLSDAGRDASAFPISKRVYIAVDDDRSRAEGRLRTWFGSHYGAGRQPPAVWGPPSECAARLREVAEAGAEMIVLTTLFDYAEQLERLSAEVLPRFEPAESSQILP